MGSEMCIRDRYLTMVLAFNLLVTLGVAIAAVIPDDHAAEAFDTASMWVCGGGWGALHVYLLLWRMGMLS